MTKAELLTAIETIAHVAGPMTTCVVVLRELVHKLPDDVPAAVEPAPAPEPAPARGRRS